VLSREKEKGSESRLLEDANKELSITHLNLHSGSVPLMEIELGGSQDESNPPTPMIDDLDPSQALPFKEETGEGQGLNPEEGEQSMGKSLPQRPCSLSLAQEVYGGSEYISKLISWSQNTSVTGISEKMFNYLTEDWKRNEPEEGSQSQGDLSFQAQTPTMLASKAGPVRSLVSGRGESTVKKMEPSSFLLSPPSASSSSFQTPMKLSQGEGSQAAPGFPEGEAEEEGLEEEGSIPLVQSQSQTLSLSQSHSQSQSQSNSQGKGRFPLRRFISLVLSPQKKKKRPQTQKILNKKRKPKRSLSFSGLKRRTQDPRQLSGSLSVKKRKSGLY